MPICRVTARPGYNIPQIIGNPQLISLPNRNEEIKHDEFPITYFNHRSQEFEEYEPLHDEEGFYDSEYEPSEDEDEGDEEYIDLNNPDRRPPCTNPPGGCDSHCHCHEPCLYCRNYQSHLTNRLESVHITGFGPLPP